MCPGEAGWGRVPGAPSAQSPENRKRSRETGRYREYYSSLSCVIALFSRSLFLSLESLLGYLGAASQARPRGSPVPLPPADVEEGRHALGGTI